MIARLIKLNLPGLALACLLAPVTWAQGLGELPPVSKSKSVRKATPATKSKVSPRPTPAPKPTPAQPVSYLRDPATVPQISFNQAKTGQLSAKVSGRITATGFYDEYRLRATTADIFTIQLETNDPSLNVQIYDDGQTGQPILKDPQTDEFRLATPDGVLPADGEYRIRVLGTLADEQAPAVAYTLNVRRSGLTEAGYEARLENIVRTFNASGGTGAEEAISSIEELVAIDPARPAGYETLAVAWLYHRRNLAKAVSLMEQAIKLGGSARFRVAHDSQWRKPERTGSGPGFPDARTSWLSIRPDQATLTDVNDEQRIYFSLGKRQIKEVDRTGSSALINIKPPGRGARPFLVAPVTRDAAEAETIVNMIKSYVLKSN